MRMGSTVAMTHDAGSIQAALVGRHHDTWLLDPPGNLLREPKAADEPKLLEGQVPSSYPQSAKQVPYPAVGDEVVAVLLSHIHVVVPVLLLLWEDC